jgi:hypothetical protein
LRIVAIHDFASGTLSIDTRLIAVAEVAVTARAVLITLLAFPGRGIAFVDRTGIFVCIAADTQIADALTLTITHVVGAVVSITAFRTRG